MPGLPFHFGNVLLKHPVYVLGWAFTAAPRSELERCRAEGSISCQKVRIDTSPFGLQGHNFRGSRYVCVCVGVGETWGVWFAEEIGEGRGRGWE
ncbi:hypothetical protein AVEN_172900-1 [Araneus ventricosus]|uniref:Uncharacterized protein n=1 Tax=Araneus ventricosus TaxID=182803 RepID=A0A4Y2MP07_ARAVE|nr:hypothetical protein AVEN_140299-1 [Araneus ventricosus]GBN07317.1 hypothetical protein AVEN_95720-1 [Araneus ventricosus]GBN25829.1 hypothetical protein AVEN_188475-1 [Araneus ventricosus]GBN27557.1 hypothetical protein AVEN_172900-1 [Araneus ventricosus]